MTVDKVSAREIAERVHRACDLCNSSLRTVMSNEEIGLANAYASLVGNFMGNALTNVLNPIWKEYPDLEPPEMKAPFVEKNPNLSLASREALEVFLVEANATLQSVRTLVSAETSDRFFRFGGLAELDEIVTDMESFLGSPYYKSKKQQ